MAAILEHFFAGQSLYERTVMPVCRAFGLTYMEFTVLMFLHNNPHYDTAAQIVKVRQLTKSHVSISLKGLQERGLVRGVYFPGNQKTLHLHLTEQAQPVVAAGLEAQQQFGRILVRGFSPEEVALLQDLTQRIYRNVKQEDDNHG